MGYREDIKDMIKGLAERGRVTDVKLDKLAVLTRGLHSLIERSMEEWRPQVVLSDDQVALITSQVMERLNNPLVLPENVARNIAETALYGSYKLHNFLSHGNYPLTLETELRPNGELHAVINDHTGARVWEGTWRSAVKLAEATLEVTR